MKNSTLYIVFSALVVILVMASTESFLYGLIAAGIFYLASVLYRSYVSRPMPDDEGEVSIDSDVDFEIVPPIDPETNQVNLSEQPIVDDTTLEK